MIELFETEDLDRVVTSTINGFRMGMVPTTATNINYDTVVPQPFTHHPRDGVRPAIENRVHELECIVEGQRLGLGALQSKVDRVESKVDRIESKVDRMESKVDRMDNDISEISEFTDEVNSDILDLRRQIRELQEAMRIFPCRT